MRLRQASRPQVTVEEFRKDCKAFARAVVAGVLRGLLDRTTNGLRLDMAADSDLSARIYEALELIEQAIDGADVVRDKAYTQALQQQLKVVAARNDSGLQSLLRSASHLRLVGPAPHPL